MVNFFTLFLSLINIAVSYDCAGDIEVYMFTEMTMRAGKAVAEGAIPDEYGQIVGGVFGIVAETMAFCKNTKIDNEEKEFRKNALNIYNATLQLMDEFDQKIDWNFAKMKETIIRINETAQTVIQAIDRYILTNAKIQYDELMRDVRRLKHQYGKWLKSKNDPTLAFEADLFKRTCTNMDTSPTGIQLRIEHIVSDEQGVFILAIRHYNYTDRSFVRYYNEIGSVMELIMITRGTYEVIDKTELSPEAEFELRTSIMEVNDAIFDKMAKLNEHREREYFKNITFLYSGTFPITWLRGYDSYLNRNYVLFDTTDNRVVKKYVYSLEFRGKKDKNIFMDEPRWTIHYDPEYVSILEMTFSEERVLWRQQMLAEIEQVDFGNKNQSDFYKICLKDKVFHMVLGDLQDEVKPGEEKAACKELLTDKTSFGKKITKCKYDKNDMKKDVERIFLGGLQEQIQEFGQMIIDEEKAHFYEEIIKDSETLETVISKIAEWSHKLFMQANNFTLKVEFNATDANFTMTNISEIYDEIKGGLNDLFGSLTFKCVNSTNIQDKEDLTKNLTQIIVQRRKFLWDKVDVLNAVKNQIDASYHIRNVTDEKKTEITDKLKTAAEAAISGKRLYVIRTRISPRSQDKLHASYADTSQSLEEKLFITPKNACKLAGYRMVAQYKVKQETELYDTTGMGDCVSDKEGGHQWVRCFFPVPYKTTCTPPNEFKTLEDK